MIVGPTLRDVQNIGLDGPQVDIATAFYSRRALDSLRINARRVRFLCRLDLTRTDEWRAGYIAPDALLAKIDALRDAGSVVTLCASARAHAKAYAGRVGAMTGSANLTLRGFGGGYELVVRGSGDEAVLAVRAALNRYERKLLPVDIENLREYVTTNLRSVQASLRRRPPLEDRLPSVPRDGLSARLGSYESFKGWLGKQVENGARIILNRANGQANLQGHIHRNFFGLRQFFLAYPETLTRFAREDPDRYKLSRDPNTERAIADFVSRFAVDEDDFSLHTWKTYLPRECGGRAGRHGGTIGNLNYMLPLVARYLEARAH